MYFAQRKKQLMTEEEISVLRICRFEAGMKATKGNTSFKDYSAKQKEKKRSESTYNY